CNYLSCSPWSPDRPPSSLAVVDADAQLLPHADAAVDCRCFNFHNSYFLNHAVVDVLLHHLLPVEVDVLPLHHLHHHRSHVEAQLVVQVLHSHNLMLLHPTITLMSESKTQLKLVSQDIISGHSMSSFLCICLIKAAMKLKRSCRS
ncbi:hypothetical protein V3C99_014025, partial [Haemonchus contortus]